MRKLFKILLLFSLFWLAVGLFVEAVLIENPILIIPAVVFMLVFLEVLES